MNEIESYVEWIITFKVPYKEIDKVVTLFTQDDGRYSDPFYEVIVTGFLSNNAIKIEKTEIEGSFKPKTKDLESIPKPQQFLKYVALELIKQFGFDFISFEDWLQGNKVDVMAKDKSGSTIAIECGPCAIRKAIDYLEVPNTYLWIIQKLESRILVYEIKRGRNWEEFHNLFQNYCLETQRKYFEKAFENIQKKMKL